MISDREASRGLVEMRPEKVDSAYVVLTFRVDNRIFKKSDSKLRVQSERKTANVVLELGMRLCLQYSRD